MQIVNRPHDGTPEALRAMPDGELIANEICQKAAIDALTRLRRGDFGPINEATVTLMIEGLVTVAARISAECRRRGLPFVEAPGAN